MKFFSVPEFKLSQGERRNKRISTYTFSQRRKKRNCASELLANFFLRVIFLKGGGFRRRKPVSQHSRSPVIIELERQTKLRTSVSQNHQKRSWGQARAQNLIPQFKSRPRLQDGLQIPVQSWDRGQRQSEVAPEVQERNPQAVRSEVSNRLRNRPLNGVVIA